MVRKAVWIDRGARCGVLAFALSATCAMAGGGDLTAWQEITVLTVSKLEQAVANCNDTIDGKRLGLLLTSAGLTLDEVHTHARSITLQQQIDAVKAAYQADRQGACARALDTFGPDGTARGYLSQ